ncbi:cellular nucleic acid-binding protein-like [Medicago truncatula]|uniref:cellular nucleic acid-binding protein-like n=1 Tax=Medicago truncatula TaxID=3880 RepID=UPI0000D5F833|nr:cellular nucleic acid-binding protein-like [Medicago truncatula]
MKNKRLARGNNNNCGGPTRSSNQNRGRGGNGKKPYEDSREPKGDYNNSLEPSAGDRGDLFKPKAYCFKCGDPGHYADKCSAKSDLCYRCREPGHLARDCKA